MPGENKCPYRSNNQCPAYHSINAACNDAGGRISRDVIYDAVKDAMYRLMPGWFTRMDELMDEYEPFRSLDAVTDEAMRHPEKSLDDIIHEHFRDDWFAYHDDGDEDW